MVKGKDKEKNQNIQVYVRCRPQNAIEKRQNCYSVVEVVPEKREIVIREKPIDKLHTKTFTFDRVFEPCVKQVDVYRAVVGHVLQEVLTGYNCTVFAYGQTGTGKTYTMEGERSLDTSFTWDDDPQAGIIPRTLHQLFDELKQGQMEYSVRVSFVELYNEELFDLLGPCDDTSKLRLYEDSTRKGSVIIQGLAEVVVHSKEEVYSILEKGAIKRQTAATLMNSNSSRSHTVFSITVHIKENSLDGEELVKTGKLNLVDLAGSENIGRSGAVDKRAREAGNINQSLLTLGRVITALVERAPHVPYRESKLTRLLQDSLGGRTKTSIIATVSPASINLEETLSTLDYAHRAKNITNRPEINQKLTKKTLIKEYTEEIERLRRDLLAAREKNGIFLDEETYNEMLAKLSIQEEDIQEKVGQIEAMMDEMTKLNDLFRCTENNLAERTKQLEQTSLALRTTKNVLKGTRKTLSEVARERAEQEHLVKVRAQTESVLLVQGGQLMKVADEATGDVSGLHSKLDRKRAVDALNEKQLDGFRRVAHQRLEFLEGSVSEFGQRQSALLRNLAADLEIHLDRRVTELRALRELMASTVSTSAEQFATFNALRTAHVGERIDWTEGTAESCLSAKEDAVKKHAAFGEQQLGPLCSKITDMLLQEIDFLSSTKDMLTSRLSKQNHMINDFVAEQQSSVSSLSEKLDGHVTKVEGALRGARAETEKLCESKKAHRKEMQQLLLSFQNAMNEQDLSIEASCNQVLSDIDDGVTGLTELRTDSNDYKCVTEGALEDLNQKYTAENAEIISHVVQSVDQVAKTNSATADAHAHLQNEIVAFSRDAVTAWEDHSRNLQASFTLNSETLSTNLQEESSQTELMLSTVVKCAGAHDSLVAGHQSEAGRFVRACEVQLGTQASDTTNWTRKQVDGLQVHGREIEKVVVEDFSRDLPTGSTPQRREFVYPHSLAETSPHERVLQRFRSTIQSAISLPLPDDLDWDEQDPVEAQNMSVSSVASDVSSVSDCVSDKVDCESKENSFVVPSSRPHSKQKPRNACKNSKDVRKPLCLANGSVS